MVLHALAPSAKLNRTAERNLATLPAMPSRRSTTALSLLIVIRATSFLALPAFVPVIACLVPLMIAPAAALDIQSPRIALTRDRAINGFASTGNRMFVNTGLIGPANPISEPVGNTRPAVRRENRQ
jgi:hypothetical protein